MIRGTEVIDDTRIVLGTLGRGLGGSTVVSLGIKKHSVFQEIKRDKSSQLVRNYEEPLKELKAKIKS